MAIQTINIGSSANKGDGDPLRTAFKKINENFAELNTTNTVRDIKGSVFGDDSTLLVDGVNGKIVGPIESTSILPGNGLTDIGSTANRFYNAWFTGQVETDSVLANVFYGPLTGNVTGNVSGTAGAVAFSGITGKPTTLAGYGITDGGGGSGGAAFTNIGIGADDSTIRTINEGESFLIKGGTGITTASDAEGNITVTGVAQDFTFASLTGKPTTIAGYGITDALALGTSASTALAGNTALFDGDYGSLSNSPSLFDGQYASLSGKPTIPSNVSELTNDSGFITSVPAQTFASLTSKPSTISGYGITDAYTGAFDGDFTGSVFGDDSTLLVDGVNNKIVGAVDTTSLRTSDETIALGSQAGRTSQSNSAVAIGNLAGVTTQGASSIAIGPQAGMSDQGDRAVAIGSAGGATTQGEKAVAIGFTAGQTTQGANAVAIGNMAGVTTQGAAAVAIGEEAGKTTQGSDAIAIGEQAGEVNQGADGIAIGDEAGQTNQGAESIAIGFLAGETTQAASSIAIGSKAGQTDQLGSSIAIGFQAGLTTQAEEAVAIGHQAGETNQAASSIAIGDEAGQTNQGGNTIAIGERAGHANQHANSIVINAQTETALDTTQTGEFLVKPVRQVSGSTLPTGFKTVGYNPTTGEFIYLAGV